MPGAVLPECPVTITSDGHHRQGHVTDLLALGPRPGFTAMLFGDGGAPSAALQDLERTLAARGVPFKLVPLAHRADADGAAAWDHSGRLFELYGATPGTVYLVRPDGHALGRWRAPRPAELLAAIERALGH
jgi:3-(3-hydroxy-phenyl)propionate hydroxylase